MMAMNPPSRASLSGCGRCMGSSTSLQEDGCFAEPPLEAPLEPAEAEAPAVEAPADFPGVLVAATKASQQHRRRTSTTPWRIIRAFQ
eukprot:CAMPEP_0175906484 /NCGR_PEP_ID=MMETSP0108-20121206/5568_1 /TAXON_ID=195067 ORGANISM="Goniomonas pacifica, Strain CCMP1869" /NCGR_SAMPLE_ID=MMETSP0108 /ASSEMBLY_ACC=CAM_ASM_000204 /LENGTH=86 /DNA_ID=CAMNT_0017228433 /DNA_START=71 /DNA_END=328 /DNA_ORIENTATION=-